PPRGRNAAPATTPFRAPPHALRPPRTRLRSGFHPSVATQTAARAKAISRPAPSHPKMAVSGAPRAAPNQPAVAGTRPDGALNAKIAVGTRRVRPTRSPVVLAAGPRSRRPRKIGRAHV